MSPESAPPEPAEEYPGIVVTRPITNAEDLHAGFQHLAEILNDDQNLDSRQLLFHSQSPKRLKRLGLVFPAETAQAHRDNPTYNTVTLTERYQKAHLVAQYLTENLCLPDQRTVKIKRVQFTGGQKIRRGLVANSHPANMQERKLVLGMFLNIYQQPDELNHIKRLGIAALCLGQRDPGGQHVSTHRLSACATGYLLDLQKRQLMPDSIELGPAEITVMPWVFKNSRNAPDSTDPPA